VTLRGLAIAIIALLVVAAAGCGGDGGGGSVNVSTELVTEAEFPLALTFAPDGRIFFNERYKGDIRVIDVGGQLLREPFATMDDLSASGAEWGLIGLTLDPEFESNGYVYAYYTEFVTDGPPKIAHPLIVRYTDEDNVGVDRTVLVDDLPETDPEHDAGAHIAGNLRFGPDGFLYVSIGDMESDADAGTTASLRGTIVRLNAADGAAADGNPFPDDPRADPRVFAYGLRNPFEFTFQPDTGTLYAADNGPFKCDRLLRIEPGLNYHWPDLDAICEGQGATDPVYLFAMPGQMGADNNSNVGPAGLDFVTGDRYGDLTGALLACEWNTGFMRQLVLSDDGASVESDDIVVEDCHLDVAVSPDGTVYYTNDSEIRRLVAE